MKRIDDLFHMLGLSVLSGAMYLMMRTFVGIYMNGYFLAIESNIYILSLEIIMTLYGIIYLIYLFNTHFKKDKYQKQEIDISGRNADS